MQGYLYIACGEKFVQQAIISANSLRRVDKKAHITLITDHSIENNVFNYIIICPMDYSLIDKVRYIYEKSPYEKTFFLDVDTYFYDDCKELFKLLDYFNICMAAAPAEREVVIEGKSLIGYRPYNTGVILFRKNKHNEHLFKEWYRIFVERLNSNQCEKHINPEETDQASLGLALLHSDARVYVFPNIWNARVPFFINLKGEVKIIHGWELDYEQMRPIINETTAQRCWDPFKQKCIYKESSFFSIYIFASINIIFKALCKKIIKFLEIFRKNGKV